jgi:hypothetical protein
LVLDGDGSVIPLNTLDGLRNFIKHEVLGFSVSLWNWGSENEVVGTNALNDSLAEHLGHDEEWSVDLHSKVSVHSLGLCFLGLIFIEDLPLLTGSIVASFSLDIASFFIFVSCNRQAILLNIVDVVESSILLIISPFLLPLSGVVVLIGHVIITIEVPSSSSIFHGSDGLGSVVYVDQMPAETKKGELSKEFGLYVERPFHIISGLKEERYLDSISNNMVIKIPNGRKSQLFYFDERTKSIRTMEDRRRAWDFNGDNNMAN